MTSCNGGTAQARLLLRSSNVTHLINIAVNLCSTNLFKYYELTLLNNS